MPEFFALPFFLLQAQTLATTTFVQGASGTTVNGTGTIVTLNGISRLTTIYADFTASAAGGTVVLETAPDPAFAGTWAPLTNQQGTAITFVPSSSAAAMQAVAAGPLHAIRARLGGSLSAGTVNVRIQVLT